jgi:fatty acid desaturase
VTRRAVPAIPWQELPAAFRDILRELGHTKQTYEKVQQADELLLEVNKSMRRRRGRTKYSIGSVSGPADIIWRRR